MLKVLVAIINLLHVGNSQHCYAVYRHHAPIIETPLTRASDTQICEVISGMDAWWLVLRLTRTRNTGDAAAVRFRTDLAISNA